MSISIKRSMAMLASLLLSADQHDQHDEPGEELPNDADTSLLLHFNGSLTGAGGETPTSSTALRLSPGQLGQAVDFGTNGRAVYPQAGNIDPVRRHRGVLDQAQCEFRWNESNILPGWRFTNNGMLVSTDALNNLRFIRAGDDPNTGGLGTISVPSDFRYQRLGGWRVAPPCSDLERDRE